MRYFQMNLTEAVNKGYIQKDDYYDIDFMTGVFFEDNEGKVSLINTDGGEPEDQYLYRDWAWVVPELNRALEMNS